MAVDPICGMTLDEATSRSEARRRVLAMRGVFSKHRDHLAAVVIVGQKKEKVSQ